MGTNTREYCTFIPCTSAWLVLSPGPGDESTAWPDECFKPDIHSLSDDLISQDNHSSLNNQMISLVLSACHGHLYEQGFNWMPVTSTNSLSIFCWRGYLIILDEKYMHGVWHITYTHMMPVTHVHVYTHMVVSSMHSPHCILRFPLRPYREGGTTWNIFCTCMYCRQLLWFACIKFREISELGKDC